MKKGLPLLFTTFSLYYSVAVVAQASCPVLINNTSQVQDAGSPCQKVVSFDYLNPTAGNKSINLSVKVNSSVVLNSCIDASDHVNEQRHYISAQFTACPLSIIEVTITPYDTPSSAWIGPCAGASCTPIVTTSGGSTLPVHFTSFQATRSTPANVSLKWETATETNNKGFTIERMTNGSNWETIHFIASQTANGNSSIRQLYQYTDQNNSKGISQYRIRQTDLDGKDTYSEVRVVQGDKQDMAITVFPNPSYDGRLTILFNDASPRNIQLLDMTGRAVQRWNPYQKNSLLITGLAPGIYTLRAANQSTGIVNSERIMINTR